MIAFIVCTTIIEMFSYPNQPEAFTVCEMIVEESEAQGVDPGLAVALGHHESGLRRFVVSKVGAVGPLQVLPKYYPKRCGIDVRGQVKAGIIMLKSALKRAKGDEVLAVARYNSGNRPGQRAFRWSRSVISLAQKLRGEK